jgi:glycine/D-amino acid oxidase-like deaminating enzyme
MEVGMVSTSQNGPRPRVVVVGAGIVGVSIALHLSLGGAQVTVLEAGQPGQGTSAVSFAWINARDKNPRHYHDLNRRSLDMWPRLARQLGGDIGLTWGGELRWAASPAEAEDMQARVAQLQSWGYPIRLLEPGRVKALEPALLTGPITAASYTPIDGHVDTGKVVRACLDRLAERGTVFQTGSKVIGLQLARPAHQPPGVEAVITESKEFACDAVVLAAGPDTPALAAQAGIALPLYHTFGATILTEPLPPIFQTAAVIHTSRQAIPPMNIRQLPDGSVMLHGGSHGGAEDRSLGQTDDEIAQVIEAAPQYIPALKEAKIKAVRTGRRPIPNDGLPIIGFAKAAPNLYLSVMHSGVTLAALVGEFAAIEIINNVRIDLLEPYRIERFD